MSHVVNNVEEFIKARSLGEKTFSQVERATYKYTICGAWITEEIVEGDSRRKSELEKQYNNAIDDLNKIYDSRNLDERKRVEELDADFWNGDELGFMQWANEVRPNSFGRLQIDLLVLGSLSKGEIEGIWPTEAVGITVGSIVEGVDQSVAPRSLSYPFRIQEFWDALQEVEDEASQIWNETHGCDDCERGSDTGYNMINPECKTCKGEGVIL